MGLIPAAAGPRGRHGDVAARFVVRAAVAAPSVHNTQPWSFVSRGRVISLYADESRALRHTDPAGREMVISCGAAVFNLRLAMRYLGFASEVRLLPHPGRPDHLADIGWGRYARPTAYESLLYRSIWLRRTHRGRFGTVPVPLRLIAELGRVAHGERATLYLVDRDQLPALAGLVREAELAQRADVGVAAELARWTSVPGVREGDGVPAQQVPATGVWERAHRSGRRPAGLEFAARRFGLGADRPVAEIGPGQRADPGTGVVALLTTTEDRPLDWLLAGQALQRVLLHAAAQHVSAAFHTQPLELPGYRRRIQTEFTGAYPQMLLRLGYAGYRRRTPRRPVTHTLIEHPT